LEKNEKELYDVKEQPSIIVIPKQNFITISGKGNPNDSDYSERVGVLYSLAWPIKMRHKKLCKTYLEQGEQFEYQEYTIFPLEGIWASSNPDNPLDKDSFTYTIRIRQPDFITKDMFEAAYEVVKKKKPHPLLREVVLETMEDSQCVQILHKGSFDDEPISFEKMDGYVKDLGFERVNHSHMEIYLTDPRKVKPEKYQTILRYQVKKA